MGHFQVRAPIRGFGFRWSAPALYTYQMNMFHFPICHVCTLCLKTSTFKISVTLSNVNRFSKNYIVSHHTLLMLLQFLSQNLLKLRKIQLKIVPYVIKNETLQVTWLKDINTVTPVAHVFIIFRYRWSKMTPQLVNCIVGYAAVYVTLSLSRTLLKSRWR